MAEVWYDSPQSSWQDKVTSEEVKNFTKVFKGIKAHSCLQLQTKSRYNTLVSSPREHLTFKWNLHISSLPCVHLSRRSSDRNALAREHTGNPSNKTPDRLECWHRVGTQIQRPIRLRLSSAVMWHLEECWSAMSGRTGLARRVCVCVFGVHRWRTNKFSRGLWKGDLGTSSWGWSANSKLLGQRDCEGLRAEDASQS